VIIVVILDAVQARGRLAAERAATSGSDSPATAGKAQFTTSFWVTTASKSQTMMVIVEL